MKHSSRFSPQQAHRMVPRSGEVIDDLDPASAVHEVELLSAEVLQHWGLIASPFALKGSLDQPLPPMGFYFRSPAHASAWAWLESLVSGPPSLAVLTTSRGVGTTTFLRQMIATSGLGATAIQAAATAWNHQSLDQLTCELQNRAGNVSADKQVRTVWLIHCCVALATRPSIEPSPLAVLRGWWAANAEQLTSLNVVLVARKSNARTASLSLHNAFSSQNGSARRSHHLGRWHCHELRRCVNVALHHAGAVRPAFTVSAATYLAEASGGSVARLGALAHTALTQGQKSGVRQIRQADLLGNLGTHPHSADNLQRGVA